MTAEQLWSEYYTEVMCGEEVMKKSEFLAALSEYNPWVTDREPTMDDGDKWGYILRKNTAGVTYVVKWSDPSPEGRWMRIPQ